MPSAFHRNLTTAQAHGWTARSDDYDTTTVFTRKGRKLTVWYDAAGRTVSAIATGDKAGHDGVVAQGYAEDFLKARP